MNTDPIHLLRLARYLVLEASDCRDSRYDAILEHLTTLITHLSASRDKAGAGSLQSLLRETSYHGHQSDLLALGSALPDLLRELLTAQSAPSSLPFS